MTDEAFSGHVVIAAGHIVDIVRAAPAGVEPPGLSGVPEIAPVAPGSLLTPGFVDIHSHSDLGVLSSPTAPSKITQGVTTEVVGNCGFSAFPEPSYWVEPAGKHGDLTCFSSATDYLQELGAHPRPSNVATLAGAGSIRARVMGNNTARQATTSDLARMCGFLSEAIDSGALGMSMGLMFAPGCYASQSENVALATATRRAGGRLLAVHMRDESTGLLASLRECIAIARAAELPLHLSHVKAKGRRAWGMLRHLVDSIYETDHPITFDFYPYAASMSTISSLVPAAVQSALGDSDLVETMRPAIAGAVAQQAADRDGEQPWRRITIAHAPGSDDLIGLDLEEAASVRGMEPEDLVVNLWLQSDGRTEIINHCMDQSEVDNLAGLPEAIIASDGYALHPVDGPPVHPRSFGTFPHFLRRYVVEQRRLGWPEAVRRMTSQPANVVGLEGVGALQVGSRADLAVLDPETLGSPATYDDPRQLATGVTHQVVGGQLVTYEAARVRQSAGVVLRGIREN